jgi:hypothetical protein
VAQGTSFGAVRMNDGSRQTDQCTRRRGGSGTRW